MSKPVDLLAAFVLIFFLASVWCPRPVFPEEQRPCAEDIAKFCKDVRPGGGRIISCLKKNEGELTSVCKGKLDEVQKKIAEAKQACSGDIEAFCKGIQEGEGRIARCLEARTSELSPACAEKMEFVTTKLKEK